MASQKNKLWTVPHYNAVAKEIRELFHLPQEEDDAGTQIAKAASRGVLAALALSFATRFKKDYDESQEGVEFDPVKFLNQCSADVEVYPLGELWDGSRRVDG